MNLNANYTAEKSNEPPNMFDKNESNIVVISEQHE
jgi:hypothetical protein